MLVFFHFVFVITSSETTKLEATYEALFFFVVSLHHFFVHLTFERADEPLLEEKKKRKEK